MTRYIESISVFKLLLDLPAEWPSLSSSIDYVKVDRLHGSST